MKRRVGRALEHEIAGGRQRAAVPRRHIFRVPRFLLLHRIPRNQAAERRVLRRGRVQREADVPSGGGAELEGCGRILRQRLFAGQIERHALRRQVDEAGLRIVGHRVPVMRAEGAGNAVEGLVRRARSGHLDRPSVGVVAGRPVHIDEVLGRNELAVGAIDDEEEAVLRRMQDHLARLPVDLDIGQDHRLGRGVVPVIAGRLLVVPDVFAGVGVQAPPAMQDRDCRRRPGFADCDSTARHCRCRYRSGSGPDRR